MTYRDAVRALAAGLEDEDVAWAVTASANLALRGFPVEPEDVDVLTDAVGAHRIEAAFADAVVRPVRPPLEPTAKRIRSHFGALELAGTEVEVMGDVEHRVDGAWHRADDVEAHREFLGVGDRRVPVMPLAHERRAYRALGRAGRVALIEAGAP